MPTKALYTHPLKHFMNHLLPRKKVLNLKIWFYDNFWLSDPDKSNFMTMGEDNIQIEFQLE